MSTCTICLDHLLTDLQAGKCGHVFHTTCIKRWLSTKKQCPNCNKKLTKSKLMKLFLSPGRDRTTMQSLQTEITQIHEEITTLRMQKKQMHQEHEHLISKLHQQQITTQSYIQKNIEKEEECDEFRDQIQAKDQHIYKLNQQLQTLQNTINPNRNKKRRLSDLHIDLSFSSEEDNKNNEINTNSHYESNTEDENHDDDVDDDNTLIILSDESDVESISKTPPQRNHNRRCNRRRCNRKRTRSQYNAMYVEDNSDSNESVQSKPNKRRRRR